MNENLTALLPEIALLGTAAIGLLTGSWLPRHRQWLIAVLACAACVTGLAATCRRTRERAGPRTDERAGFPMR
ncbi:hypothetical protein [Streptomyces californicus]|uniref:hypothetical protein n=1 Tax=Streptomyces californicus TaxID=67351 RepID=UPI00364D1CDD